ncbi:DUF4143 domain-containing protein [Paraeggerthella hongkongensis]|uniref:DUF4143 domain-containing protein n=1 Tax=Paraeggerthella hongkongensis TaxID=230658 RepID=UPI0030811E7C
MRVPVLAFRATYETVPTYFALDIGPLGALSGLDASSLANENALFTEFKGALTEQYVCQQLVSDCELKPYC